MNRLVVSSTFRGEISTMKPSPSMSDTATVMHILGEEKYEALYKAVCRTISAEIHHRYGEETRVLHWENHGCIIKDVENGIYTIASYVSAQFRDIMGGTIRECCGKTTVRYDTHNSDDCFNPELSQITVS